MRKVKQLLSIATAVLALAACQRGEQATVTGGYGSSVVSGNVVVEGGSPAGVVVSVRGTGMSTTLGADGRFIFAAVPDDATLDLRAPNGMNGSLAAEGASNLAIELSASGAKKSGKRRGAGRGNPLTQFEGLIRSATAEQVVVYTSKQEEVTIALDAATTIRKGNTALTAADLRPDTRVHVKARKTDAGFTAVAIIVQSSGDDDDDGSGDDAPAVREYEGTVVSSAADRLVIVDARRGEQTFAVNAQTVIRKGNTPVLPAEILPGMRVHVKATEAADGTKTAVRVIVQNTNTGNAEVRVNGTVTAVAASSLTVQAGSASVTVNTDAATKITKRGSTIALTAIVAGDRVRVEGTRVDAATVLAKEIQVK